LKDMQLEASGKFSELGVPIRMGGLTGIALVMFAVVILAKNEYLSAKADITKRSFQN